MSATLLQIFSTLENTLKRCWTVEPGNEAILLETRSWHCVGKDTDLNLTLTCTCTV